MWLLTRIPFWIELREYHLWVPLGTRPFCRWDIDRHYILNDYDHTDSALLAHISLEPKWVGTEFDPTSSLQAETVDYFPAQNKIKIYLPEIEETINADTDEKMNLLADSSKRMEGANDDIDAFTVIPPFFLDYFCMCEAFEAKSMLDATLRIFKANYYTHTKSGSIKVHQHGQVKKIILFLFLALKIDRDDGEFVKEEDLQKCICSKTSKIWYVQHTFFSFKFKFQLLSITISSLTICF